MNNIIILVVLLGVVAFYMYTYKQNSNIREISTANVRNAIEQEQAILIDVRTDEEWKRGHHPLSIHIPIDRLVFDLEQMIPDKHTLLLFCCKKGIRSEGAAIIARKLGYRNVSFTSFCLDIDNFIFFKNVEQ